MIYEPSIFLLLAMTLLSYCISSPHTSVAPSVTALVLRAIAVVMHWRHGDEDLLSLEPNSLSLSVEAAKVVCGVKSYNSNVLLACCIEGKGRGGGHTW